MPSPSGPATAATPTGQERVANWLAHWPDPNASDDLVLTGPQVMDIARALKFVDELAEWNDGMKVGDGRVTIGELIDIAKDAWRYRRHGF